MKPGGELDKLICERVMLCSFQPDAHKFSTDISHAMQVLDKIKDKSVNGSKEFNIIWDIEKKKWKANWTNGSFYNGSESLPHAICLAALESIGGIF